MIFSARRKDFRIDTFRSGGKGGQHQNKTNSGVRITHIETGLSAESRSSRSQTQNRKIAFKKLTDRLTQYILEREKQTHVISKEVVRTYNLPANRVKDHISGFQQSYSMVEQDIGPMMEARRLASIAQLDRAQVS